MQSRTFIQLAISAALAAALPAHGESGLRVPQRGEPGLDPSFARGWLAPNFDRFGFATPYNWKEAAGLAASPRMNWSYAFGNQGSLGMTYDANYVDPGTATEGRQYGLFGRYSFATDWSVSAQAMTREPGNLLRLHDFRIGVQRRF